MEHSIVVETSDKAVVHQELSDVFFLVTDVHEKKNYRVIPKGFLFHSEPHSALQLIFGNQLEHKLLF